MNHNKSLLLFWSSFCINQRGIECKNISIFVTANFELHFMKKTLHILLLLCGISIFGQGIIFEKGTFKSVLEKAKKENKLIFLDAYTTWCGPCKLLEKNVFPKQEVGDFYNKNFINAHIDMEKGEGITLAKKYKIYSYPSLFFINGDGEVVYKTAGYIDATQFIEMGKAALNPENKLESKIAKFNAGETNPEFLMDLIKSTYTTDPELAKKASERYFKVIKPSELSREDAGLLLYFTKSTEDANYSFFVQNKKELEKYIPVNVLEDFDKQIRITSAVQKASNADGKTINNEFLTTEMVKILGEKDGKMLSSRIRLEFYFRNQNYPEYEKAAVEYYTDPSLFSPEELNDVAWNFYLYVQDKNSLLKATQWSLSAIQAKEEAHNTDTLARIFYKAGDLVNAKKWAIRSIEIAKSTNAEYTSTEELLKKIK